MEIKSDMVLRGIWSFDSKDQISSGPYEIQGICDERMKICQYFQHQIWDTKIFMGYDIMIFFTSNINIIGPTGGVCKK